MKANSKSEEFSLIWSAKDKEDSKTNIPRTVWVTRVIVLIVRVRIEAGSLEQMANLL